MTSRPHLTITWFVTKLLLYGQRFLVYPAGFLPRPRNVARPSTMGLSYRDIEIRTSDNVLLRFPIIEHEQPKATILMFHGNAMDHTAFLEHALLYGDERLNVVLVSYRGYGNSEGVPSEKGLQRDAQAALDYVLRDPQMSTLPIIVYGLSLGGAVAIDVTSKNPDKIKALIIENTFTSIPDIVRTWPIIGRLSFACTQRWNSASKISKIPPSLPILFCSGLADKVVPPAHMNRLWEIAAARGRNVNKSGGWGVLGSGITRLRGWLCASGSGTLRVGGEEREDSSDLPQDDYVTFPRRGHADTYKHRQYWSEIREFLDRVLPD